MVISLVGSILRQMFPQLSVSFLMSKQHFSISINNVDSKEAKNNQSMNATNVQVSHETNCFVLPLYTGKTSFLKLTYIWHERI